jgi:hypothetical protein
LTGIKAAQPLNRRESHKRGGVKTSAIGIYTRDSTCCYRAKSSLLKNITGKAVLLAINH